MASYIPACYTSYLNSATELTDNEYDWSTQENCADFTTGAMTLTKFKRHLNNFETKLSESSKQNKSGRERPVYLQGTEPVPKWMYTILKELQTPQLDDLARQTMSKKAILSFEQKKEHDKGKHKKTVTAHQMNQIKKKLTEALTMMNHGKPEAKKLMTPLLQQEWSKALREYHQTCEDSLDNSSKEAYDIACKAANIALLEKEVLIWTQETKYTKSKITDKIKFIQERLQNEKKRVVKQSAWSENYWESWKLAKRNLIAAHKSSQSPESLQKARDDFNALKKTQPHLPPNTIDSQGPGGQNSVRRQSLPFRHRTLNPHPTRPA